MAPAWFGCMQGLSPRLRGNRHRNNPAWPCLGSIPAPAGEPPSLPACLQFRWVYPRACGGTQTCHILLGDVTGLSPRLRGNHYLAGHKERVPGSIPAPAGEPIPENQSRRLIPVYPRACGGTLHGPARRSPWRGLSPRLRGNQLVDTVNKGGSRSIPAPAGEPGMQTGRITLAAVYPRACGGTSSPLPGVTKFRGLSPRLRGNREAPSRPRRRWGSIPAPAGEPLSASTGSE